MFSTTRTRHDRKRFDVFDKRRQIVKSLHITNITPKFFLYCHWGLMLNKRKLFFFQTIKCLLLSKTAYRKTICLDLRSLIINIFNNLSAKISYVPKTTYFRVFLQRNPFAITDKKSSFQNINEWKKTRNPTRMFECFFNKNYKSAFVSRQGVG